MGLLGDAFKEPNAKRYIVKYLQGITGVAEPSTNCTLIGFSDGLSVKVTFKADLTIPWQKILDIKAETQGEITERISLNKAAFGYFLFGPVGALLAASKKEKKDERSFFLTVVYLDNSDKQNAILIESKSTYDIFNDINTKRENYCKSHNIDIKDLKDKVSLTGESELTKLVQQKNKGLIGRAEFEAKKKMLSGK